MPAEHLRPDAGGGHSPAFKLEERPPVHELDMYCLRLTRTVDKDGPDDEHTLVNTVAFFKTTERAALEQTVAALNHIHSIKR